MTSKRASDTEELMDLAAAGDDGAVQQLLERHRRRLRQMVGLRLDPRLNARLDASDIVQETMLEASRRLPDYLRRRPLPFYPWLRQIAWERLMHLHVQHVQTQKRSVRREVPKYMGLPDDSVMHLADRFVAAGSSPSRDLHRKELQRHVREAVDGMAPDQRELLLMRFLEQLSIKEIAATLRLTEGAVNMRLMRALELLRRVLADRLGEEDR